MQFSVRVYGLPASLGIARSSGELAHRFRVYADGDRGEVTFDSLDSDQRWRFANSEVTHSNGRFVENLEKGAPLLADKVLSGLFDEFANCVGREIVNPTEVGWSGGGTRGSTWREVRCSWLPKERVPALFLGYSQLEPEPPQLEKVLFELDGEEMEIWLSRVVYDRPLPDAASSPIREAPQTYYVPPLRPGATFREKMAREKSAPLRKGD
jgi:hypothetical protein